MFALFMGISLQRQNTCNIFGNRMIFVDGDIVIAACLFEIIFLAAQRSNESGFYLFLIPVVVTFISDTDDLVNFPGQMGKRGKIRLIKGFFAAQIVIAYPECRFGMFFFSGLFVPFQGSFAVLLDSVAFLITFSQLELGGNITAIGLFPQSRNIRGKKRDAQKEQ